MSFQSSFQSLASFQSLPLDLRRKIALDLSPTELIKLCLSSKEVFYKGICNNDEFWRLKIEYDYPEIIDYFRKNNLILRNPKNTYIRTFSRISEIIEKLVKKENYDKLLSLYNEMRTETPYKNEKEFNKAFERLYQKIYGKNDYQKMRVNNFLWELFLASPLHITYGAKLLE